MNKRYFFFALVTTTILIFTITVNKSGEAMPKRFNKGFAVVELFTSEGCSSCPAADETVARLLAKKTENVYILAFHVDYWDQLGWKDPFSKLAYSQRQSQYASVFNLESVYTPQVIVNGSSQFVGSDEDKLNRTVEKDLQKQQTQHFTINSKRTDKLVSIDYEIDGNEAVLINLALVQPEGTISVKRGENGGKTLHHVNIVRAFKTFEVKGIGKITMDVPEELAGIPLQLISYTQEKNNLHILGADKKTL